MIAMVLIVASARYEAAKKLSAEALAPIACSRRPTRAIEVGGLVARASCGLLRGIDNAFFKESGKVLEQLRGHYKADRFAVE
jgi:hypothetical protein